MESRELKRIIADQREQYESRLSSGRIVPRERISCNPQTDLITVVTGPRRAGKTTFCLLCVKDKPHAYINFDDERVSLDGRELNSVAEAFLSLYPHAQAWVFDEIQNIAGWERFISRISQNRKVIITGSNSNLLSGELATYLTGRHTDVRVFPFSFGEYLNYRGHSPDSNLTSSIAKTKSFLERYLIEGGYPLAYKGEPGFHLSLYSDVLQKDILSRFRPKRPQALKDLARLLVSNSGLEVSFNKLRNVLGLESAHTVKKYASYLENAFLIFMVKRFSYKLKEQLMAPKKVYCIDSGLVSSIAPLSSSGKGRLIETLVAVELLRRSSLEGTGEFCYWKDHSGREVDFVALEKGKPTQLIQVCHDASNPFTLQRELEALRRGMQELNLKKGTILTWDEEKELKEKYTLITFTPLWKWLLE
ncbi:ATP-binding protein, partial [Candidatus Micrarchaeota archaeon]|nr:ATP-binding protein [Candidatus Micrarchaeota archaeon]